MHCTCTSWSELIFWKRRKTCLYCTLCCRLQLLVNYIADKNLQCLKSPVREEGYQLLRTDSMPVREEGYQLLRTDSMLPYGLLSTPFGSGTWTELNWTELNRAFSKIFSGCFRWLSGDAAVSPRKFYWIHSPVKSLNYMNWSLPWLKYFCGPDKIVSVKFLPINIKNLPQKQ